MKILQNRIAGLGFKSNTVKSEHEYSEECRDDLKSFRDVLSVPYYSIYEKSGGNTDNQLEDLIGTLSKPNKTRSYDNIFSLPLKNVEKIDGTENSYRGQTLLTANKDCMDTIKKTGIKTVVDLVDYMGFKPTGKWARIGIIGVVLLIILAAVLILKKMGYDPETEETRTDYSSYS